MATRVRFRFNKATGEVEEFVVDDGDRTLSEADHDRIAVEVGERIAARPRVTEVRPGEAVVERPAAAPAKDGDVSSEADDGAEAQQAGES